MSHSCIIFGRFNARKDEATLPPLPCSVFFSLQSSLFDVALIGLGPAVLVSVAVATMTASRSLQSHWNAS
jgi:hypothetical protein